MTTTPLFYELPANLSAKKFFKKLGKELSVQIESQQYAIRTYYDSFDWRLYNADMILEFIHSQTASQVSLTDRKSAEIFALENMPEVPKFSKQFPNGQLQTLLVGPLEMRALLPLCQLPYTRYRIHILNNNQKIILRIELDEYELLSNRVRLLPLKGYDKAAKKVRDILQKHLDLKPTEAQSVLKEALKAQGRKPKDYKSKLEIKLSPDMSAEKACKVIFQQLLQAIKTNETGTIANIDTEFLHDFRVAVRRTRTGLSLLKSLTPVNETDRFGDFFSWLGEITGPTRDLDVYLLSVPKYKQAVPISLRENLAPLYLFLKNKHNQAQKKLAEQLNSAEYRKQLDAWEQFVKNQLQKKGKKQHIDLTAKQLADHDIWKIYKRIIKDGEAITENSPPQALHDLRKKCKKLRYLIEFFQNLYPEDEIKKILKALKGFQTVLGDFQDYEVQETSIKQFSEEMMENKVSPQTFLAMGVLVQYLDSMKCKARNEFATQFAIFEQKKNQHLFKTLFAHKSSINQ